MKRTFRGMSLVMMVLVTACGGGVRPEGSQPEVPQAGILVQHAHRTAVLLTAMDQAGHGMASMDETGEVCLWDGDGRIQARIPGQGGEEARSRFLRTEACWPLPGGTSFPSRRESPSTGSAGDRTTLLSGSGRIR